MRYSIIMDLKMVTVNELIGIIDDAVSEAYSKTSEEISLLLITSLAADIKNWLISINRPKENGLIALSYMLSELKARLMSVNVEFNYKEVFSLDRSC
jgi:hypothetical protein